MRPGLVLAEDALLENPPEIALVENDEVV